MATIDTEMYADLKKWCDWDRPQNQFIKFMYSKNKMLTNATIRKVMFEIDKGDKYGEKYVALYSAKNFIRNMRTYFTDIAKLYRRTPDDDASLEEILERIPATCTWITLIIKDLEELSGQHDELEQVFRNLVVFATKGANLILIADSDYEEIFSECKYASAAIKAPFGVNETCKLLLADRYEQDENPEEKELTFESASDEREELNFYWSLLYERFEQNYFDYEYFKVLFIETWEYFIPRVATKQIFRQDISLIERIEYFNFCYSHADENNRMDGCSSWELEAAKQFVEGLNNSLIDWYCEDIDFSDRTLFFRTRIDIVPYEHGSCYVTGGLLATMEVTTENFMDKIDMLAEAIHLSAYDGDSSAAMKLTEAFLDD